VDAIRKSVRQIRGVIGAATISPELLTAAERIQYEAIPAPGGGQQGDDEEG
jgi:hypothetical protein